MAIAIKHQPAQPRRSVTNCHEFFKCDAVGTDLFTVRGGIQSGNSLFQALCFINSAREILYTSEGDNLSPAGYGALYLLEMAEALVHASHVNDDEPEAIRVPGGDQAANGHCTP